MARLTEGDDTKDVETLLKEGRDGWEAAYLRLKAATETEPDSLQVLLLLVKACLLLGGERLGEAVVTARHAVEVSQDSLPDIKAPALNALGAALYTSGTSSHTPLKAREHQHKEAEQSLERAISLLPGLATALFNLSKIQAEAGSLLAALKTARAALTASASNDASVWALLALILTARQETRLVHSVIDTGLAATHTSQHSLLLKIKASLHTLQEEHTLALECLAKAQARAPADSRELWQAIGVAFLEADRVTDAEGCLENMRQSSRNSPNAFCCEAKLHQARSNWKAATDCCLNALALEPRHADACYLLGCLYFERGKQLDHNLAQGYLLDAVAATPSNAEVWYQLGLVNKSLGQIPAAESCFKTSLSLKRTEPILPFRLLNVKL